MFESEAKRIFALTWLLLFASVISFLTFVFSLVFSGVLTMCISLEMLAAVS